MFINSKKIYEGMMNEHSGIWFSDIDEPNHPYISIKLPQIHVKSVMDGCEISLALVEIDKGEKSYLTTGLIVK